MPSTGEVLKLYRAFLREGVCMSTLHALLKVRGASTALERAMFNFEYLKFLPRTGQKFPNYNVRE